LTAYRNQWSVLLLGTKIIAIASQKGGGGKATIAVHLATAATLAGLDAVVIDLDPQTSAASWGDDRGMRPNTHGRASYEASGLASGPVAVSLLTGMPVLLLTSTYPLGESLLGVCGFFHPIGGLAPLRPSVC
jgi:hypothetical protein